MKKNRMNAFTLVEMLIVIVIIGILIAALMPRMQAAQGRARDVSRKTALSQIQSAIVTSQWDKWEWPWVGDENCTENCAQAWMWISAIQEQLTRAWMNSIPVDPLKTDDIKWLGKFTGNTTGDYAYIVIKRNWTDDWWFVLMAKTEVEWSSNWIVKTGITDCSSDNEPTTQWCINKNMDITNIHPCTKLDKDEDNVETFEIWADGTCKYGEIYRVVLII